MSRLWLLLLFLPHLLFSQTPAMRGVLLDRDTRNPVSNAHLRVRNTFHGSVSDRDGNFTLSLTKLPAVLEISCLGYESITLEVVTIMEKPVTLFLTPRSYNLNPVTISDKPAVALYKEEDYSVLDFDFLDNNLLLIVFRYQLNRSEIILMTTDGDTLQVVPVPASPPLRLYRDVLSNIHYITKKDVALQAVYDPVQNHLFFPFRTTYDTLRMFLGGYRFVVGDRLWFQEDSPRGFMTSIGYYSKSTGKMTLGAKIDAKGMRTFYKESWYYHTTRLVPEPIDEYESRGVDAEAIAYKHFFWKKGCGELFKVSDTSLAFFNFCGSRIEMMDGEGNLKADIPISFQMEKQNGFIASLTGSLAGSGEWEWNRSLVQDAVFNHIYALFSNNGFIRLKYVDLTTGTLVPSGELPFEFPEKIKVFRGEVYFLYRGPGERENRKLYKMALR
jgi:hypothetical protein